MSRLRSLQPDILSNSARNEALTGRVAALEQLRTQVLACTKCALCAGRNNVVFGDGPADARAILIGEAPGAQEDEVGMPFVGRSGQLLTRVLEENGIRRDQVFISNIVRCRPEGNRDPRPEEIRACRPWLEKQIEIIDPPLVCVLGRYAASTLLGRPVKIMAEHGIWQPFEGRRLLIALHPSAALRMPKFRAAFEEDIRALARELDVLGNQS